MSEPTQTRDFFISFTGADRDWAAWIAWTIEEAGYSVWFQDWDFRGNFVLEMDRAHTRSRRTIAVLSPAYFESRFAAPEWAARFAEDGTSANDLLVPVRVVEFRPPGLLAQIVYVDFVGIEADAAKARLLQRLSGIRRKPTEPPVFPGQPVHREVSERPVFPGKRATHNLPPRNPDFVGRETTLDVIQAALALPNGQPLVVTQAITGLGGVGKTQTALAFAHRQLANCDLVWWLNAETPAMLAADYAGMAGALGIPELTDQGEVNSRIKSTLQGRDGWLLVFDNVEDQAMLRPYLPTSGGGSILITSRRSDWQGIARTLPLDVMNESDALCLLTGQDDPETSLKAEILAEAKALANDLGHLPLALAQARAFVRERGYAFKNYRKLFDERLVELMARGADGIDPMINSSVDAAGQRRQRAVAATWDISVEAAEAKAPGARQLLELLSFFAPISLPLTILDADIEALPEELRDVFARDDALAALSSFSLVKFEAGNLLVHRLVQAITRASALCRNVESAKNTAATAALIIFASMPKNFPRDSDKWKNNWHFINHPIMIGAHATAMGEYTYIPEILYFTSLYMHSATKYLEDNTEVTASISIDNDLPRIDENDFFGLINKRVFMMYVAGRKHDAERFIRHVIANTELALGPGHPDLDSCKCTLVEIAEVMVQIDQALAKNENRIQAAASEPENPNYLILLNYLATLHRYAGNLSAAESLYQKAIDFTKRCQSADRHQCISVLHNYADLLDAVDRRDEAEVLRARAQAVRDVRAAAGS